MRYDKKWTQKMLYKRKSELIEIIKELLKEEQKITSQQNKALRLFFKKMSDQFKEIGMTHVKEINGIVFDLPIEPNVFLEEYWRPIQKALFGTESTTDLNTKKINAILDVLTEAFSGSDINVVFPSKWEQYLEQLGEKGLLYENE